MNDMYSVSYAPHINSNYTTRNIMEDVVIALIPACLYAIYRHGFRALLVILISILTCTTSEYLFLKFSKKEITKSDYSEIVTGILLALNLSVDFPLWLPVLGGAFAILIVKMLYGGIGQNFMNPALAARAFLLISFPTIMIFDNGILADGGFIMILIGAAYLLYRRIISFRIPLSYLITFIIFILLFADKSNGYKFLLDYMLDGGLLLGVFFMANDYSTSPDTQSGKIVFGIFVGILTAIFKLFGSSRDSVVYAIIIANMFVPIIEKFTVPKYIRKEQDKNERK